MVCPLRSSRMAVMARLLAAGSFSQTKAEVGHQKLAARYIYRELRSADEENLLDEEDMHVFGLNPMVDPLHLVCCNACKKPVKASHYASHAELCRSVYPVEETILEIDGGKRHKKPPKKERKKLAARSNKATAIREQERSEMIDADDSVTSGFQSDRHTGISTPQSVDAPRNLACVDATTMLEGSGISPVNTDHSASIVPPPTKRSKLTACGGLPSSDDPKLSSHDACTYIPAPLASKMYYSQRNNRFRMALKYLYEASSKEVCSSVVNQGVPPGNLIPLKDSFQKEPQLEHMDKLPNMKES